MSQQCSRTTSDAPPLGSCNQWRPAEGGWCLTRQKIFALSQPFAGKSAAQRFAAATIAGNRVNRRGAVVGRGREDAPECVPRRDFMKSAVDRFGPGRSLDRISASSPRVEPNAVGLRPRADIVGIPPRVEGCLQFFPRRLSSDGSTGRVQDVPGSERSRGWMSDWLGFNITPRLAQQSAEFCGLGSPPTPTVWLSLAVGTPDRSRRH